MCPPYELCLRGQIRFRCQSGGIGSSIDLVLCHMESKLVRQMYLPFSRNSAFFPPVSCCVYPHSLHVALPSSIFFERFRESGRYLPSAQGFVLRQDPWGTWDLGQKCGGEHFLSVLWQDINLSTRNHSCFTCPPTCMTPAVCLPWGKCNPACKWKEAASWVLLTCCSPR